MLDGWCFRGGVGRIFAGWVGCLLSASQVFAVCLTLAPQQTGPVPRPDGPAAATRPDAPVPATQPAAPVPATQQNAPAPATRPPAPATRPPAPVPEESLPAVTEAEETDIAAPPTEEAGDALLQRGRYVAALRTLEAVEPKTAVLLNKIGVASEHLAMFPKAKECFERAIVLDPKYAEAYNNLATVYHAQGDLKEAEKLYRRSIRLQPRGADAYQNLGALYYSRGRFHKGDVAYKRAILLDRNVLERTARHAIQARDAQSLLEVHYHLARNCALAGNPTLAVEYLHKAIAEGFRDTKRLLNEEAFTDLRKMPQFTELMEDIRGGR